jgi:hypothetical protein
LSPTVTARVDGRELIHPATILQPLRGESTADVTTIQKKRRPSDQKKFEDRHWTVVELFKEAEKQGLASPGWEPFSTRVRQRTGVHIPPGSLKYWHYGHSEPRVGQIEAMATALGLELDLFLDRREGDKK